MTHRRESISMLGPAEFRELVSGRRQGAAAAAMRGLLRAAEVPYTLAVNWRNRRYDRGRAKVHRVGVPVVSVGNLTLGGTGKTPMVKWLARWFGERGVRVAIVSRGYGHNLQPVSEAGTTTRRWSCSNRCPTCRTCRIPIASPRPSGRSNEFDCQLVLLDDGFQHRRLARDLDIVLLDALEPFGFDHVFPRGTLREPVAGLQRAHVVCLSRADAISAAERACDPPPRRRTCPASRLVRTGPRGQRLDQRGRRNAAARQCLPAGASPRSAASATRPAFDTRLPPRAATSPPGAHFPITTHIRRPTWSRYKNGGSLATPSTSSARTRTW